MVCPVRLGGVGFNLGATSNSKEKERRKVTGRRSNSLVGGYYGSAAETSWHAAQAGGSALGLVGWDGSAGGKGDDFYLGTKQEINSVATEGHLSHGPNPPTHFLKAKTRTTPTCPPTRHIGWGGGMGRTTHLPRIRNLPLSQMALKNASDWGVENWFELILSLYQNHLPDTLRVSGSFFGSPDMNVFVLVSQWAGWAGWVGEFDKRASAPASQGSKYHSPTPTTPGRVHQQLSDKTGYRHRGFYCAQRERCDSEDTKFP